MHRLLLIVVIALVGVFAVERSGVLVLADGVSEVGGLPPGEHGELQDDIDDSDLALAPPLLAVPQPRWGGPVVSRHPDPVVCPSAGGVFRPPCLLRA